MLVDNGSQRPRDFKKRIFKRTIQKSQRVSAYNQALGHSNSICIEGESSVILIDTLDSLERGKILLQFIEEKIRKRISTIIYTHGHPDHRGGAARFYGKQSGSNRLFTDYTIPGRDTAMLQDIKASEGSRQFGYNPLTDGGENISQGHRTPRRESPTGEQRVFVPPSMVYQQDQESCGR